MFLIDCGQITVIFLLLLRAQVLELNCHQYKLDLINIFKNFKKCIQKMKYNKFYLSLFFSVIMLSSCKSRLINPIILKYADQNIEASASFSEFSKKENLYYG